ncbi:uncharacterized protein CXQ87_000157 [Candidozyma duobushaemuli]|uniref:SUI1 domain-containing protein n=1 Tax=Candidozyma duobushaemuli TaxID=1231522 RepID=A0A2V1AJ50_9ASCO|nr:uncharacterized protein CXQ87_000157 [[Candida] duobushaemulonis]PVH17273.1 hypothetical protein CXQ87_000157 [[Candida] duobushaemulonis]
MFKKDPQPKPSSNIKSSERRGLLATVCKEYGINKEELPKETELKIVPATIKQASYQSVQGHKGIIYFDTDEKPVWFKTRDSPLYPTIYTMWQVGGILPIILTNNHVIEKLTTNANLMLPGSIPPFDSRATRGALVGIASYQTPTVVKAIGHCSLNLTQFDNVQGRQGTAVTVIHVIEDELFKLYDNDVEVPTLVDPYSPSAFDSLNKTLKALYGEDEEDSDGVDDGEVDEEDTSNNGESTELPENDTSKEENGDIQDAAIDEISETVEELSIEDIDNFFNRAFLQSVKLNPSIELPISASQFMGQYVLKNLPKMDSKYCNVKKTSWKKSAKFLKALEKENPPETLANFVTHRTNDSSKGSGTTPSKKDLDKKLSIVSLYKPTSKTRMVYNKLNKDFQNLYTQVELKGIVNDYINAAGLVDKSKPKFVGIDEHLKSATGIKEEKVTRDKIINPFTANHSPHYVILKPGEVNYTPKQVHKGTPPKIKILTHTVLGRKKVTTVVDFEKFFIKPATLAEDLKNKCSGSTSVGPCVHNPNLTEVMVQGPHGTTIIEYLKSKGVPISFIDFEDKSKGRKRK